MVFVLYVGDNISRYTFYVMVFVLCVGEMLWLTGYCLLNGSGVLGLTGLVVIYVGVMLGLMGNAFLLFWCNFWYRLELGLEVACALFQQLLLVHSEWG